MGVSSGLPNVAAMVDREWIGRRRLLRRSDQQQRQRRRNLPRATYVSHPRKHDLQ